MKKVFTLQSIKSRIETKKTWTRSATNLLFLLYSPLNQGLKHIKEFTLHILLHQVFTLQSIKSRIET